MHKAWKKQKVSERVSFQVGIIVFTILQGKKMYSNYQKETELSRKYRSCKLKAVDVDEIGATVQYIHATR